MLLLSLSKKILTPRPKLLSKPLWPPSGVTHLDIRTLVSTRKPHLKVYATSSEINKDEICYTYAAVFYSKPHLCNPPGLSYEWHNPVPRRGSPQGSLQFQPFSIIPRWNGRSPSLPVEAARQAVSTRGSSLALLVATLQPATSTRMTCNLGP